MRKLTRAQVNTAYDLLVNQGLTRREVAEKLGWDYNRVKALVWRNDWPVKGERPEREPPAPKVERAPLRIAPGLTTGHSEANEHAIWKEGDARYVAALAREILRRGWLVRDAA